MSDIKKDHSIGEGTGAGAGAIAGAVAGSAVAGPVGTAVGAVVGAIAGAKTGGAIAEAVNPTEYNDHFQKSYTTTSYYNADRDWNDYGPAYQYGYQNYDKYRGERFEDVEDKLASNWDQSRAESRLAWNEAKGAVRDGWHYIERAMPGDADRDGR